MVCLTFFPPCSALAGGLEKSAKKDALAAKKVFDRAVNDLGEQFFFLLWRVGSD